MKYYQDANGILFQTNTSDTFFLLPDSGYAQPVTELAQEDYLAAIDASNLVVPKQPMSVMQQMTIPDLLAQTPEEIVQVINAVVNNIPLTTDQIDAWNIAYAAHENAAQIDVTENKQSAALTSETG